MFDEIPPLPTHVPLPAKSAVRLDYAPVASPSVWHLFTLTCRFQLVALNFQVPVVMPSCGPLGDRPAGYLALRDRPCSALLRSQCPSPQQGLRTDSSCTFIFYWLWQLVLCFVHSSSQPPFLKTTVIPAIHLLAVRRLWRTFRVSQLNHRLHVE